MGEAHATGRHAGIELGRAVAMLAVVLIHVPPTSPLNAVLRPLAELGVPYFFVVSGFVWGRGQRAQRTGNAAPAQDWRAALGPLRRPLALYALGFVVYGVLPLDGLAPLRQGRLGAAIVATARGTLDALLRAPLATLLDGPPGGFHLWFLPALALGLGAAIVATRLQRERWLVGAALALFTFGLLAGRYATTPVGVPLGWSVRNGPFQSVLLVGVGALMASWRSGRAPWRGPLLLALGQLIVFTEWRWLGSIGGGAPGPDVFSAAVLPLGVGAFLCFYDLQIASRAARRVAVWLGGTTLGVYLWHVLLRVPLASVLAVLGLYPPPGSNPLWGFLALYALSVLCVVLWRALLRPWGRFRRSRRRGRRRAAHGAPVELEAV